MGVRHRIWMPFFEMTPKVLLVPEALAVTVWFCAFKRQGMGFPMGARLRFLVSKYRLRDYN